jgi:curved DNA-binding protein CbpA
VSARIPNLKRGIDVYSLPLSTKEGFILSRVDGVSSVEDISIMVGVKLNELLLVLDRLADLGVVQLGWRAQSTQGATTRPDSPSTPASPLLRGDAHPAAQRVLAAPLIPFYIESELDEPADLTDDEKRRILNCYYGLEGKDYYALLGLDRSADKKEIRAAYFELSRLFHPDSKFGKKLGSFQVKMEGVFKRLTEAYEVLGRNQRRHEYDEYLASTASTSAIQHRLDQVESEVRALSTAPPHDVSVPAATIMQPSAAEQVSRPAAPRELSAPASDQTRREEQRAVRPPPSAEERNARARERLRRSFSGAPAVVSEPPLERPSAKVSTAGERRDSAIKGLRQTLRQTGQKVGGVEPVMAHLRKAREAEMAGDLLGAASELQAALALQPEHRDLQAQYERVSKAVTRNLADNYEKQAQYEEKLGKWAAAALSWERASEGRPENAQAAHATAEALLKSSGDLHKAQRFAQRALDAVPHDVTHVVTLARVLLAAGLRINARRELEKAVKLDPQNEMIKNLLREAR